MDAELVLSGNASEIRKIDAKIQDLGSTINEIEEHRNFMLSKLEAITSKVEQIDNILGADISEKIKEYNSIIKTLDVKKTEFNKLIYSDEKREKILKEIGLLQTQHDTISDKYEIPDFSKELLEFIKEVSIILTRRGFPGGNSVTFDKELRDIDIGGKPRGHFGKGYRAISFSAFVVASVDEKKRKVTFDLEDGSSKTVKVNKDLNLSRLPVGETVTIQVGQGLALSIEK